MSDRGPQVDVEQQPQPDEQNVQSTLVLNIIGTHIAEIRMVRAAKTMERMDHKEALYNDLGHLALGEQRVASGFIGPLRQRQFRAYRTASNSFAMPRTFVERSMDRRIDKISHQKSVADTIAYRDQMIYGQSTKQPDFYIRERTAERIFGKSRIGDIPAVAIGEHVSTTMFGAPELEGMSKNEKRLAKARVSARARHGEITASEVKIEKLKIDATRMKLGEQSHKTHHKLQRNADKRLRNNTNQEFVSRWRDTRRKHAIGRIQSIHQGHPDIQFS